MSQQSKTTVDEFWQSFLASLPAEARPATDEYQAWHFCDNESDANELAALTRSGIKQATCGLLWAYQAEGQVLPQSGDISIITDWRGQPQCIIETTEVQICAFNEVDQGFAAAEGEGDGSLESWRRVHWDAFARECAIIGRRPRDHMPVVCERFRLIYAG